MNRNVVSPRPPSGRSLKRLMVAVTTMIAVATMVVTATISAQQSNAPNPPTGLMTELVTSNSARIAWQPSAVNNCQVSEYNVLVTEVVSTNEVMDARVPRHLNVYLIQNLNAATPFEVRVYAYSEDPGCDRGSTPAILPFNTEEGEGPSTPSTATTTTTPVAQPVVPRPLNVPSQPQNVSHEITHNQLVVSWNPSTVSGGCGLSHYIAVLVAFDGEGQPLALPVEKRIEANASLSATFRNLTTKSPYYVYLAAVGDGSCDGHRYSPKVELYFDTKPVPPPPTTTTTTIPPFSLEEILRAGNNALTVKGVNPTDDSEDTDEAEKKRRRNSPTVRNLAVTPSEDGTASVTWDPSPLGQDGDKSHKYRCVSTKPRQYRYKVPGNIATRWRSGQKPKAGWIASR